MALPGNTLSSEPVYAPFLDPDDRALEDFLVSYERGGIAIQDPSQGMDVRTWKAFVNEQGIWLRAYQAQTPTLFIAGEDISLVSLAFDNNMRPAVCYRQLEVVKLSWYDPTVQTQVITEFPDAYVGCVTLDNKREHFGEFNDVLFFYVVERALFYRQQRDRYTVERFLAFLPYSFIGYIFSYVTEDYSDPEYAGIVSLDLAPALHMEAGMNRKGRVQISIGV